MIYPPKFNTDNKAEKKVFEALKDYKERFRDQFAEFDSSQKTHIEP